MWSLFTVGRLKTAWSLFRLGNSRSRQYPRTQGAVASVVTQASFHANDTTCYFEKEKLIWLGCISVDEEVVSAIFEKPA